MLRPWTGIVVAVLIVSAHDAFAAPAPASDVALSREKVKEGVANGNAGDWEAARSAFTEAYRLWPRPGILFNLAGAEVKTGHVLAGIESYRRVLADPDGLSSAQVTLAESAVRAAEARVAHVTIHASRAGCVASLDDTNVAVNEPRALDPGTHHTALTCSGETVDRRDFAVSDGESRTIELLPSAVSRPAPPPAEARPAPPKPSGGAVRTVGWALAGTAVAAFGVSAFTGLSGIGKLDDLENGCGRTGTCAPDDVQSARTLVTVSDALLVVGIACAAGAIYALLVHPALTKPATASTPLMLRF